MNRLIYNGVICCIVSLYTLEALNQSNVMLWFTTMNRTAAIFHGAAIVLLAWLGLKQKFVSAPARRTAIAIGLLGMIASIVLSWASYYSLPLLPVDWLFIGLVSLALVLTGLNLPETAAVPVITT